MLINMQSSMLLFPNQKAGCRSNFNLQQPDPAPSLTTKDIFANCLKQFSSSSSNQVCKSPKEDCGKTETTSGPSADKTEAHNILRKDESVSQSSAYFLCYFLSLAIHPCLKIQGHQICPLQSHYNQFLKFMLCIQQTILQLQAKVFQLNFPTIRKLQIMLQQEKYMKFFFLRFMG